MTQDQFNTIVDAITKSVAEKLKADVSIAPVPKSTRAVVEEPPDMFDVLLRHARIVLKAVPTLGQYLSAIPERIDGSTSGGRGMTDFLLHLGIAAIAAPAAEASLRFAQDRLRTRLAAGAAPEKGLRSLHFLGVLALLDGLGVAAVWLVGRIATNTWFSGASFQDRLAVGVLAAIVYWRLYCLAFHVILRPDLPAARLCQVTDTAAQRMYRAISAFVLLTIIARLVVLLLSGVQAPLETIAAGRIMGMVIIFLAFVWFAFRSREAASQWLGGLGKGSSLAGAVGRHWNAISVFLFLLLSMTQIYGAASGLTEVPTAMILTLNVVIGLLIIETIMQALVRRLDSQLEGFTPASDMPKLPDVVARCVHVGVLIAAVVLVARSWVVHVLALFSEHEWEHLTRTSRTAGITLFAAYVIWELFQYATELHLVRKDVAEKGDGSVTAGSARSRLRTFLPLLRATVAVVLCVVASLIALDDIGVNITPLLAGASVLGLAVSFGSQALVKDIVSGIFYLTDDAFRIGEYIDCGKGKGTVEGFTLRSVRLRNQSGTIYTIPFGDLGEIANISRDWTAVNFNLRFARDTDLEKLREAAKKIGAEMMEVAELKGQLLETVKMQGIDDVADNALVIRFKFTARPGNPGSIQNEAVTRMLRTFPRLGIEFAK